MNVTIYVVALAGMTYLPLIGQFRVRLVMHINEFSTDYGQVVDTAICQLNQNIVGCNPRLRVRASANTKIHIMAKAKSVYG